MKVFIIDMFGCKFPDIGYQLKSAFEDMDHEVNSFHYRKFKLQHFKPSNFVLNKLMVKAVKKHKPELVLVNKGESILPGTISKIKEMGVTTANWYPDEPFGHLVGFNKLRNVKEYDHFFIYDKKYVKDLKKVNPNSYYLPPGASPKGVFKEKIEFSKRTFPKDVCLVATAYPNRVKLMDKIKHHKLNLAGPRWNKTEFKNQALPYVKIDEMVKLFNESKIILNPYGGSKYFICPNPRTFEIPATKSFQLTDIPYGVEDLFKPKKEIVTYKSEKEFKELVSYYLDNDEERNKIALAGYKRVVKEHTIKHRVEEMLKKIKKSS